MELGLGEGFSLGLDKETVKKNKAQNQNHNEVSPHTGHNGHHLKVYK